MRSFFVVAVSLLVFFDPGYALADGQASPNPAVLNAMDRATQPTQAVQTGSSEGEDQGSLRGSSSSAGKKRGVHKRLSEGGGHLSMGQFGGGQGPQQMPAGSAIQIPGGK